nr:RecName: Full=Antifungal protein 1; Short=Pa-AFP1 [Passiflora alata]
PGAGSQEERMQGQMEGQDFSHEERFLSMVRE